MGFFDKIKDVIKKFKEDNANFGATMRRINGAGFCGNVNRGIKKGDFWEGSYISIEDGHGVIYGSNQEDYTFTGENIKSFEIVDGAKVTVNVGKSSYPAKRFIITFNDGKQAQADIIPNKLSTLKTTLNLQ